MEWVRRNQSVIPWALLCADLGLRLGTRLYKSYDGYYQDHAVADSPVQSLVPKLHKEEAADLPYPPDTYPGARDVTSPYGSLRVYEWGPEDGRKVLLVHGITNPCVALGGVAQGLVDRGCRVILFGKALSKISPSCIPLYQLNPWLKLASVRPSWTWLLLCTNANTPVSALLYHLHPISHNIVLHILDREK